MREIKIMGCDEVQIQLHEYDVNNCDYIVVCVHGMAEHSKRYDEFAKYLNQHNVTVYTYDHRGHGQSCLKGAHHGDLGKDGFNKMVEDLNIIINYVKEKNPRKKLFLLGHSMGSFVVQDYIQKYKKVSGVILSGSSYKQFGMRIVKLISWVTCLFKGADKPGKFMNQLTFGSFNKKFQPNRTDFDWVNSDPNEVDKYVDDEFCGFISTNQFYYDFISALIRLQSQKNIAKIRKNLPVYIISGKDDPVGKESKKVKELYEVYKQFTNNIDIKVYEGSRHEILLEKNKGQVYGDILRWLEKNK